MAGCEIYCLYFIWQLFVATSCRPPYPIAHTYGQVKARSDKPQMSNKIMVLYVVNWRHSRRKGSGLSGVSVPAVFWKDEVRNVSLKHVLGLVTYTLTSWATRPCKINCRTSNRKIVVTVRRDRSLEQFVVQFWSLKKGLHISQLSTLWPAL